MVTTTRARKTRRDPKPRELEASAAARARLDERPLRPDPVVTVSGVGVLSLSAEHTDDKGHAAQLMDVLGTASNAFTSRSIGQLVNAVGAKPGECDSETLGAALALVAAIAPQDELEAALAIQMAASHELAMSMAAKIKSATVRPAITEYGNLMTKASRTFAAQMDALTKLRRGGEQVVRHVHVYEGGQAVVAETVNVRGTNVENIGGQSHALPPVPEMLSADPFGSAVPSFGRQREEAVSDARRDEHGRA